MIGLSFLRKNRWVLLAVCAAFALLFFTAPMLREPAGEKKGRGETVRMAFYHWKTLYDNSPQEDNRYEALGTQAVYLRLFDVVKGVDGTLHPVATVRFRAIPKLPVTPVVYIDNDSLRSLPLEAVPLLSEKIAGRVKKILHTNRLSYTQELQLDCDWTPSTQARFFSLVRHTGTLLPEWRISVTLRLHQYRYPEKTGVPPADRVCLMAYNMGVLREFGDANSILDVDIARKYLINSIYPLPLDIAFPLFSWGVLFTKDKFYNGLLRRLPPDLGDPLLFEPVGAITYRVRKRYTMENGTMLPRGSYIRAERSSLGNVRQLALSLAKSCSRPGTILFYHMEREIVEDIDHNEIGKILDCFQ